jgi:peptide deformylase
VQVSGSGFFARCLQHEVDHLDGLIYVDRLVGRYARAAKRALKRHGWGEQGLAWDPAAKQRSDQAG